MYIGFFKSRLERKSSCKEWLEMNLDVYRSVPHVYILRVYVRIPDIVMKLQFYVVSEHVFDFAFEFSIVIV